ncbi:histidine kinase dimerization/phospho-acceptor domain-containing protein [Bacillus mycoides]|uniref:histidine kinase dimerization/phospho-acceptor domain-containing protein n=1 Tax=Bacillus mycoides TaxID=1405 RepID=UPI003824976F
MKRKKSLLSSLIIQYVVIIITAILSSVGCIAYLLWTTYTESINSELRQSTIAKEIVRSDYKNIQADAILKKGGWIEITENNRIIYTIGEKKDTITNYGVDTLEDFIIAILDYTTNTTPFTGDDGKEYYCIVKIPDRAYVFSALPNLDATMLRRMLFAILFFFVLNGCTIYFVVRKFLRPLKIIKSGIKNITDKEHYIPLNFNSCREVEEVKHVFNQMVHTLNTMNKERRENEERRKRMLCDISHDIRTPMTSIIGYSKALVEEKLTLEKKNFFQVIFIVKRYN